MRRIGTWYLGFKAFLLAGAAAPGAFAQTLDEGGAWDQARRADTLQAYESFLEAHPLAPEARLAFRRLIDLSLAIEPGAGPSVGPVAVELY
ncbi:MAG: hypothetical protein KDG89_18070 [Geminicoccaceae bacterium]|nr:hypothetical protein [Geminicoccaceae bacterium]